MLICQFLLISLAIIVKVGLILFSDLIEEFIPPKKTRGHVWRVIRKILTHTPKGSGTALGAALKYLNETVRKSSITFIISDFLTDNYKEALKAAYMIHDLIPIVVRDPLENEFNHPHRFMLQDMESGASQEIDFSSKSHRDWFSKHRIEERTSLKRFFDHMGMDSLFLENGHDYMQPLIKLFRLRERR